ncbi:MAG TPA: amidohydrolase, partial [Acetobacteraceae bacterium]|nr:amidohydrolase [Acetobacteraceae bacterium]
MTETTIDRARRYQDELTEFRRDIHAHPELGLEEHRTAERVAGKLAAWGIEVHRGVGKTGVVGVLRNGDGPSIGLRADMDALPMEEQTNLPYSSRNAGRMHACGHDGHTTMLLGAAKYLADTRNFKGTVNFIFQPGEEGAGGALAMLEDKLFERFPCDAIFGMHNRPGMPVGQFGITPGLAMAGAAMFDVVITGKGGHGARPEVAIDPVVAAFHVGAALQSIVSRNVPPHDMAVVSITRMHGGDAYNVIPQTATLGGTVRTFKTETMQLVETNMKRLASSVAAGFGAEAEVDFRIVFAALMNDVNHAREFADAAAGLVGDAKVDRNKPPA